MKNLKEKIEFLNNNGYEVIDIDGECGFNINGDEVFGDWDSVEDMVDCVLFDEFEIYE